MKILYIFPHPDDESFGPAAAISRHLREGREVYLLTLTKGGATKQRHKYGYSVEQMGDARYREMRDVEKTLGLTGLTVLDLPDSGLKELDPREIEMPVEREIAMIKPDVLATYAVHGISGFPDHLVTHAVVKRVYCQMREAGAIYLKRLALFTTSQRQVEASLGPFHLSHSKDGEIDCALPVDKLDIEAMRRALNCYTTYRDVIEETKVLDSFQDFVYFEFFRENFDPAAGDVFEELP